MTEAAVSLDEIRITRELASRAAHGVDPAAERTAHLRLADELAQPSRHALQEVVAAALHLCRAGSAGISLLETVDGRDRVRWVAVAGALHDFLWAALPRDRSLVQYVIDADSPQLFRYPERHLRHLAERRPQIVEALVVPLRAGDTPVLGAIWIVTHNSADAIDGEDLRVLEGLAHFAMAAHQSLALIERDRAAFRQKADSLVALNSELRESLASISNAVEFLGDHLPQGEEIDRAREMIRRHLARLGELGERMVDAPSIGHQLVPRAPNALATRNLAKRLKRERVLVIDDSVDAADSMAMLLRAWGHDVRIAQGANAGLQLEWEFEPHAVILDIEMPGKNGYEVASELRVRRRRDLLLVALSGYVREEDRARSLAAGFDHHMTKPADLALLERILS